MRNATRFSWRFSLLAVALLAVAGGWSNGKDRPASPLTVHSYKSPDGQVFAALLVRPEMPPRELASLDVVVLADTSASQNGEYRLKTLELASGLVRSLRSGDEVLAGALDVSARYLSSGFEAAGSSKVYAALEELARRAPLGTCDLHAGLGSAADRLAAASSQMTGTFVSQALSRSGTMPPRALPA